MKSTRESEAGEIRAFLAILEESTSEVQNRQPGANLMDSNSNDPATAKNFFYGQTEKTPKIEIEKQKNTANQQTEIWTSEEIAVGQKTAAWETANTEPNVRLDSSGLSWSDKTDLDQIDENFGGFDGQSRPATLESNANWVFDEELDDYRFESPQPDNKSPNQVFAHEAELRGQIAVWVRKAGIGMLLLIIALAAAVSVSEEEGDPVEKTDNKAALGSSWMSEEGTPQSGRQNNRIQTNSPKHEKVRSWVRKSKLMIQRKQFSKVLTKLKRWIRSAPQNPHLRCQYAKALSSMEKPKVALAISNYKKAIALDSSFAEPYYHLSLLYIQMHKPNQAQIALDSFVRLRPKDKRSLNAQKRIRMLN